MNDIVAGLLECTVAIRIPEDHNEAHFFLMRLAEAAPNLRWNDGSPLPKFCPSQNTHGDAYYHRNHGGGLMWDSRAYLEAKQTKPPILSYVDTEEVFPETTDLSDFLNDLL